MEVEVEIGKWKVKSDGENFYKICKVARGGGRGFRVDRFGQVPVEPGPNLSVLRLTRKEVSKYRRLATSLPREGLARDGWRPSRLFAFAETPYLSSKYGYGKRENGRHGSPTDAVPVGVHKNGAV